MRLQMILLKKQQFLVYTQYKKYTYNDFSDYTDCISFYTKFHNFVFPFNNCVFFVLRDHLNRIN